MDALEEMRKKLSRITPKSSGDIIHRASTSGFTSHLTRRGGGGSGGISPFRVNLYTIPAEEENEEPTYEVTVGWGYVVERLSSQNEAVVLHEPANLYYKEGDAEYDPENPFQPKRFPITPGESVYVKVNVTEDGVIGEVVFEEDFVFIIVTEDDLSTAYHPKVDDLTSDGEYGYYYYKLIQLNEPVAPSTTPTVEKFLTGSHISYWPDRPPMKSTMLPGEGIGCVIKEWSTSLKAYVFRALFVGLGKNNITTEGDHIEVRGTKKDAALTVRYGDESPSEEPFMEWSDGYMMTGQEIVGDEDPLPEPEDLTLFIPAVQERPEDPQVTVSQVGAAGTVYQVEGNNKDGSLTYTIGDESPVTVLEWMDGLVTSEGDENNIPIPAGGGGGLPPGTYTGDLLVWVADAEEWQVLTAPEEPAEGEKIFIEHPGRGNYPEFITLKELEVDICEEGTPTPYIIYGKPNPPPEP
jgi:hypothetical protein